MYYYYNASNDRIWKDVQQYINASGGVFNDQADTVESFLNENIYDSLLYMADKFYNIQESSIRSTVNVVDYELRRTGKLTTPNHDYARSCRGY